jgi:hypothetical protein
MKQTVNFPELFPEWNEPNRGPGISYCIAPNARMFDYELALPGERSMRGCIRAVNKKDAERILKNRHPGATKIDIGKGRRIFTSAKKA